jgi:hypothetical protein
VLATWQVLIPSTQGVLRRNAKVYLACRSRTKAEQTIRDLAVEYPENKALFLELDLASLESVRKASEEFLRFATCLTARSLLSTNCTLPAARRKSFISSLTTGNINHVLLLHQPLILLQRCHGPARGHDHRQWLRPSVWHERHRPLALHRATNAGHPCRVRLIDGKATGDHRFVIGRLPDEEVPV